MATINEDALFLAVLACPHSINANEIVLKFDPKQKGDNALNQLSRRISEHLAAASANRKECGDE